MYKKFYNLTRNPFEISPDPYFFYPTSHHNEALANLTYGIHKRKGFVVVTGEVGTGKTLLLRFLMETLGRYQVASAFVCNPRLPVLDFLAFVLTEFGIGAAGRTKGEMLSRLNEYLIARARAGGATALIIDEAHLLTLELLEEIRLLTNLETSQQKLLQIVLVGQPELDHKLDSPQLRQLKQRIGLRCQLEPLGLQELRGYVYRRLELAGADSGGRALFPDETIVILYKCSRGIPRLANTLCENSLIVGLSKQAREITPEIVEEVAANLSFNVAAEPPSTGPHDSETRKRILRMLSHMIEELDDISEETPLVSGAKAE